MKKKKLFSWALFASMISLSACSNDVEEVLTQESEIKLTSEIAPSRVTSLEYQSTQIVSGQKVGVTIEGSKSESYVNKPWTVGSEGALSPAEADKVYWKNTDVNITAYHPYNEGWTNGNQTFTVNTDQSIEANYSNSDLLFVQKKNVEKTTNAIPLEFEHKLAKINVTLVPEFEGTKLGGATISICNVKTSTTIDLSDGTIGEATGNETEITAGTTIEATETTPAQYTASAIVVPQTVANGTKFIKVVLGSKTFYYTLSADKQLKSGYSHNYTLTVKETALQIANSSEINNWTPDNGNTGDAEEVKTIPNNKIWYTTTDGNILNPLDGTNFGANIISNIYQNGLGVITFDGNVTQIGTISESESNPQFFFDCERLSSIILPESIKIIGDYTFGYTSLTDVKIPNGVTDIGRFAFRNCNTLLSATLPENLTNIHENAFYYCENLKTLTMPNVVTIKDSAFEGCNSLTTFSFPSNLLEIGKYAFSGCNSIVNIAIPQNITTIGSYAFYCCEKLEEITVADEHQQYSSYDGVLYDKSRETLICFPCAKTSITFSNSIKTIEAAAFVESSLTTIEIPYGVETIGNGAFCQSSISKVTIPASIENIGSYAFSVESLSEVYCKASTPPMLGNNIFLEALSYTIYVPEVNESDYKNDTNWKDFANRIQAYNFE